MFNLSKTRYICPVCGFPLKYPADDANICPSCGVQFGYDNADHSIDELRRAWLDRGAEWTSTASPKPANFDAMKQLQNLSGTPSGYNQAPAEFVPNANWNFIKAVVRAA